MTDPRLFTLQHKREILLFVPPSLSTGQADSALFTRISDGLRAAPVLDVRPWKHAEELVRGWGDSGAVGQVFEQGERSHRLLPASLESASSDWSLDITVNADATRKQVAPVLRAILEG